MFYLRNQEGCFVWKTPSAVNAARVQVLHSNLEVVEDEDEHDVPSHGKVSVMAVLCVLFSDLQATYTPKELKKAVPGASWQGIITALSDMKNPKYNKGAIIKVRKRRGTYVRE